MVVALSMAACRMAARADKELALERGANNVVGEGDAERLLYACETVRTRGVNILDRSEALLWPDINGGASITIGLRTSCTNTLSIESRCARIGVCEEAWETVGTAGLRATTRAGLVVTVVGFNDTPAV